jgi:hypothetical protein
VAWIKSSGRVLRLLHGGHRLAAGVEVAADGDQGLRDEIQVGVGFGVSCDGDSVLWSFRSGWWGGVASPPLTVDWLVPPSVCW